MSDPALSDSHDVVRYTINASIDHKCQNDLSVELIEKCAQATCITMSGGDGKFYQQRLQGKA